MGYTKNLVFVLGLTLLTPAVSMGATAKTDATVTSFKAQKRQLREERKAAIKAARTSGAKSAGAMTVEDRKARRARVKQVKAEFKARKMALKSAHAAAQSKKKKK